MSMLDVIAKAMIMENLLIPFLPWEEGPGMEGLTLPVRGRS